MNDEMDPRLAEPDHAFRSLLGFALTAWREHFARVEMPLGAQLMNRQGLPHGGVHATLLDTAMGYAGCYTGDPERRQLALTLSMTVNFLAQAQGDLLIAEGWRTGGGRRTFFAEGRVTDRSGTVIAAATGVFRYRSS